MKLLQFAILASVCMAVLPSHAGNADSPERSVTSSPERGKPNTARAGGTRRQANELAAPKPGAPAAPRRGAETARGSETKVQCACDARAECVTDRGARFCVTAKGKRRMLGREGQ